MLFNNVDVVAWKGCSDGDFLLTRLHQNSAVRVHMLDFVRQML